MYGSLASEVYDLTKSPASMQPDFEYYYSKLKNIKGAVLEAGCGNGRLMIPLLKGGIKVMGLDVSPEMIKLCQKNLAQAKLKADVIQADLQNFDLGQKFEAIVMPVGSFMLFDNVEAARKVLKNFARHLIPNGRVFLDIGTPSLDLHLEGQRLHRARIDRGDGSFVNVENTLTYRILDQVEDILIRYEDFREGRLVNTELQQLPLRWWGLYEFSVFAKDCGFKIESLCADHLDAEIPSDDSTYLCYELSLS
jgi:SAM-dependent methyltransferase